MELEELLERVDSRDSFLRFVRALAADRVAADAEPGRLPDGTPNLSPGGWENGTVADFLEAMAAWASSTSGPSGEPMAPAEPSWRAFAEILCAGKFYE